MSLRNKQKNENEQEYFHFIYSVQYSARVLARAVRQEKKINLNKQEKRM